MKRIRLSGYFTVEAAYVFPLVLLVLFCGMYLCFHCYNTVAGISVLQRLAIDICEAGREGQTEDEQTCCENGKERLEKVLLYGKAESVEVRADRSGCLAGASIESVFQIPGLLPNKNFSLKPNYREIFWCDTDREQIRRAQCIRLPKVQN